MNPDTLFQFATGTFFGLSADYFILAIAIVIHGYLTRPPNHT